MFLIFVPRFMLRHFLTPNTAPSAGCALRAHPPNILGGESHE